MLGDKVAAVYGGSGSIGSAVAREFSEEGAKVFLVGRTQSALDEVTEDVRSMTATEVTISCGAMMD